MANKVEFSDRMLSLGLARVSEAAAIASASLIGHGDEKAADQAAVNAMRDQLNLLDIKGVVVIGEGERDEAPMLFIGEEVGTGDGPAMDIALDPLEGTTLTAKDMPNALTVIAGRTFPRTSGSRSRSRRSRVSSSPGRCSTPAGGRSRAPC